jgi:mono/diheme cytochrome c family protein
MRLWKVLLIVIIAIVVGVAGYAAGLIRRGFSALTPPSRLETVIARTMRRMAIPSAASKQRNPLAGSAETPNVIAAGRAHWADHCATCHGNDGSGLTQIGENLYPKAPDMRLPATQNLSDGELYYIIVNGVRLTGMPAWGEAGTGEANENWQLVSFIRHMPQITPEELEEMKALNPKTEADRAEEQQEQEFLNGGEAPKQPSGEEHQH